MDAFTAASATYIEAHRPRLHVKSGEGFEWMPDTRWTLNRWLRCMAPAIAMLIILIAWNLVR